ncbi:MAG: hypothetical protein ACPGEG_08795 [Salibacteraceae bacterium]
MRILLFTCFLFASLLSLGQAIPSTSEGFKYFVTFGNEASPSWGDDDFNQTIFFLVPKNYNRPFYIRIFDPDIGGLHDEKKGEFNTYVRFSLFGGVGAHSTLAAKGINPEEGYDSGTRICSKTFGNNAQYDNKYFVMGPFKPIDGEYDENMGGYIFKLTVDGVRGDDGNLYNFFLSTDAKNNISIDGANAFTYEYALRLQSDGGISHIYPFIDKGLSSVILYNFDYDKDGEVYVYTVDKNRHVSAVSGDNVWSNQAHQISEVEHNTSMDVQLYNKKGVNNNVTVYVLNQYEEAVGFFSVPIGGIPKYRYKVKINMKD